MNFFESLFSCKKHKTKKQGKRVRRNLNSRKLNSRKLNSRKLKRGIRGG